MKFGDFKWENNIFSGHGDYKKGIYHWFVKN